MARAYPLTDLVKLVRAYGVLAGTGDMDRVIAGELSRRWIAKEVEHMVPLSALPAEFFNTQRGRDLLANEVLKDQDIDPEMLEDLIRSAVNEGLRRAKELSANDMTKMMGNLNLPGMK